MIPMNMVAYLKEHLPEAAVENRIERVNGKCFLEFGYADEHLLSRMEINCDRLGPRMVTCMWNETSPLEIGGYLVVDNLAVGSPSMGGIRMLPEITPADIHNLARGMTLKNAAARLPYGGGKAGIVAESDISPEERTVIIQGFGAVGAHSARFLIERLLTAKIIGISNHQGYLYDSSGP